MRVRTVSAPATSMLMANTFLRPFADVAGMTRAHAV
jgi:hypothetical protein